MMASSLCCRGGLPATHFGAFYDIIIKGSPSGFLPASSCSSVFGETNIKQIFGALCGQINLSAKKVFMWVIYCSYMYLAHGEFLFWQFVRTEIVLLLHFISKLDFKSHDSASNIHLLMLKVIDWTPQNLSSTIWTECSHDSSLG
jgi:hypothetical protein